MHQVLLSRVSAVSDGGQKPKQGTEGAGGVSSGLGMSGGKGLEIWPTDV